MIDLVLRSLIKSGDVASVVAITTHNYRFCDVLSTKLQDLSSENSRKRLSLILGGFLAL